jgi:hypothetical protein
MNGQIYEGQRGRSAGGGIIAEPPGDRDFRKAVGNRQCEPIDPQGQQAMPEVFLL